MNFENTEMGEPLMLVDAFFGDLIYEVDGANKLLGRVKRIGCNSTNYEIFVEVYDSTNPSHIGQIINLSHKKGLSHYGPHLYKAVVK
jgi:hypothetical protein